MASRQTQKSLFPGCAGLALCHLSSAIRHPVFTHFRSKHLWEKIPFTEFHSKQESVKNYFGPDGTDDTLRLLQKSDTRFL
jgi:hypothetical protein